MLTQERLDKIRRTILETEVNKGPTVRVLLLARTKDETDFIFFNDYLAPLDRCAVEGDRLVFTTSFGSSVSENVSRVGDVLSMIYYDTPQASFDHYGIFMVHPEDGESFIVDSDYISAVKRIKNSEMRAEDVND